MSIGHCQEEIRWWCLVVHQVVISLIQFQSTPPLPLSLFTSYRYSAIHPVLAKPCYHHNQMQRYHKRTRYVIKNWAHNNLQRCWKEGYYQWNVRRLNNSISTSYYVSAVYMMLTITLRDGLLIFQHAHCMRSIPGPVFSYKLRYIVDFGLVEMSRVFIHR